MDNEVHRMKAFSSLCENERRAKSLGLNVKPGDEEVFTKESDFMSPFKRACGKYGVMVKNKRGLTFRGSQGKKFYWLSIRNQNEELAAEYIELIEDCPELGEKL